MRLKLSKWRHQENHSNWRARWCLFKDKFFILKKYGQSWLIKHVRDDGTWGMFEPLDRSNWLILCADYKEPSPDYVSCTKAGFRLFEVGCWLSLELL